MEKDNKINYYRIYTRRLAAQLRAKGFELLGIDKDYKHPGYDNFLFEDTPELRKAIQEITAKT